MKTLYAILMFFTLGLNSIFSQTTFQELIKADSRTYYNRMSKTTDGGFVHAGSVDYEKDSVLNHKIVLTKYAANANIEWKRHSTMPYKELPEI